MFPLLDSEKIIVKKVEQPQPVVVESKSSVIKLFWKPNINLNIFSRKRN